MKNKILILFIVMVFLVSCNKKPPVSKEKPKIDVENLKTLVKDVDLDVKEKGAVKLINEFSYKSFYDIIKEGSTSNIVYSPYSYGGVLKEFTKITDSFKDNEILGDFYNEDVDKLQGSNLKSKSIILANKDVFEEGPKKLPNLSIVEFPKEAEKASVNLQKEILGKVLLEPEYGKDLTTVLINASKFYGKWEEPFEKSATREEDFLLINNEKVKTERMNEYIDYSTDGFKDLYASATRKAIKSEDESKKSYVYIIVPNKNSPENIYGVGKNIHKYVYGVKENQKEYDSIFLSIPKLDMKSKIDLLEVANNSGYGFEKEYSVNSHVLVSKDGFNNFIKSMEQVATLYMDEDEVKAEAVTEMKDEAAAEPIEDPEILEVIADKPYFIVITCEDDLNQEFITFMSLVQNPNEK